MIKIIFQQLIILLISFNYINAKYVINKLNNQSFINDQPKISQQFKGGWLLKDQNFDNYLHFNFYHQLIIKLDRLDFEFDQLNLKFDYFIFNHHNDKVKDILEANLNVAGESEILKLKFDQWQTVSIDRIHKIVEDSIFELKFSKFKKSNTNYIKNPIDQIDNKKEIDKIYLKNYTNSFENNNYLKLEQEDQDHPIYIKNLKLTFTLSDIKIIDINDELFTAKIDDKEIDKNKLIHFHFIPKLNDEIEKYYYTFEDDSLIDWSIDNLDLDQFNDVCLKFKYQSTRDSLLKLKLINKTSSHFDYYTAIELDNTEILIKNDNNLNYFNSDNIDDKINYEFEKLNEPLHFETTKWREVSICLRDLCPECVVLKKEYNLKFEVSIENRFCDRLRFLAITDIDVRTIKNNDKPKLIKNYLTNYKTNGSFAKNEWMYFTDDINFELITDRTGLFPTTNLKLNLEINPYMSNKKLYLISEWIQIKSNTKFEFDIESQFDGAYYKILILNYKLIILQSTSFKLIKKGNQSVTFEFTDYLISLLKDKPAKIRIEFDYKANNDNVGKNLIIKNLAYADPCIDEFACSKSGICYTLTNNKYECECSPEHAGSNCQFRNHCRLVVENGLTGNQYCLIHNATDCIPNDDSFRCLCNKGFQFNDYTMNCEPISNCLFIFCKKNEVCEEKDGIALCRCKLNYFENEKGDCVYDLCKNQREEEKCDEYERCLTVYGKRQAKCICPLDHQISDQKCLPQKKELNPFVKQFYNCSHTYIVVNNEIHCQCYKGYTLADDRKSCIGDLASKCKPKCNHRQICVLNEFSQDYNCQCLIGFSGPNCENQYCDNIENKNDILHICGTSSCFEKRLNKDSIGFECNCHRKTSQEDDNGLCKLKDVCSKINDECDVRGGICIPQIDFDDRSLNGNCLCHRGQGLNENKCESMCNVPFFFEKEKYKTNCQIDFKKNESSFDCEAGFLLDKNTNECIAGQNLIQLNFDFKYKNLITTATEFDPPVNDYPIEDYYCDQVSYKEQCIESLNNYRLKEHQIMKDKNEFYLDLKSKLLNPIIESLKILIDPKLFKRVVINKIIKKDEKDIDFENDGLNAIYTMNLIIEIDSKLKIDTIKNNFKIICLKDEINLIEGDKKLNYTIDSIIKKDNKLIPNNHCVIRPYIYLINSKLKIEETNICDLNCIKCKQNSKCKHNRDTENNVSKYSCECMNGFESRFKETDRNIEMNICTDIDECINSKLNDCDSETTECENTYGSFRCNCKENFKIVNRTHCSPICGDPSTCGMHGKCKIFEGKYEICECDNGYKGSSCSRLDNMVINLKTLLLTVSIILSLLLVFIILITYIYVKKIQIEDKQKLLKNEQMIPMNEMSFDNNLFQDDEAKNMSILSNRQKNIGQDIIEEEIENGMTNF